MYFLKEKHNQIVISRGFADLTGGSFKSGVRLFEMCALAVRAIEVCEGGSVCARAALNLWSGLKRYLNIM